jgi:glycosyltransferase involved in cell wall biosynthesis
MPSHPSSVSKLMQVQHGGQLSKKANSSVDAVAIVIPVLNEAAVMPRLLRLLQILDPAPAEIVAIDGGSQDKTAALVRQSGFVRLIEHAVRGRAAAINRGVLEIRSPLVCVLHADTILPDDGIAVIRATMQDPRITMFFRRSDFLAVGGCDETLTVMEDADLCLRLFRRGRIKLVNRTVTTSDRRIAVWGGFKANLIYLYVGIRWAFGLRHRIEHHYPDIR